MEINGLKATLSSVIKNEDAVFISQKKLENEQLPSTFVSITEGEDIEAESIPLDQKPTQIEISKFNNEEYTNTDLDGFLSRSNKNLSSHDQYKGLSSALESFLKTGENEYRQEHRRYLVSSYGQADSEFDNSKLKNIGAEYSNPLSMSFRTKEGDKVELSFSISHGHSLIDGNQASVSFRGIGIEISVDGELSDEEQDAINQLAKALESSITSTKGFSGLDSLPLFESNLIQDLSITLDGPKGFKLQLTNNEDLRSIKLEMAGGGDKLSLTIDKSNLGAITENMEPGKSHFLQLIDESVRDAKGNKNQARVIKDGFSAILKGMEEERTSIQSKPVSTLPGAAQTLTGLPDFDLEFQSEVFRPAELAYTKHNNKSQQFNLSMSQHTDVSESNDGRVQINQANSINLNANYFEASGHLESPIFATETFKYVTLERSSNSQTKLSYDENKQPMNATYYREIESNKKTEEWVLGKLEDTDSQHQIKSYLKELTSEIKEMESKNNKAMIDGLLPEFEIQ